MIHLYVDDLRPCPKGFVLARTAEECLLLLRECEVDMLSLDHDLGWNRPNGLELAQRMARERLFARDIYLHSANPRGRMDMFQLLYREKPEGVRVHLFPVPEERLAEAARQAEKR